MMMSNKLTQAKFINILFLSYKFICWTEFMDSNPYKLSIPD